MAIRTLLLYALAPWSETLSYQRGWPRHFLRDGRFACEPYDLAQRRDRLRLARRLVASRDAFDAVVVLHSVFSNTWFLDGLLLRLVARQRAIKAYFVGNEYKLMPEKMRFCDALGVRLLVTHVSAPEAHELYRRRLGCAVAYIPYTGLDEEIFSPGPPLRERPIDLGFRAYRLPLHVGHDERDELVEHFRRHANEYELRIDVSLDDEDRMDERRWADFLRSCRGQLGTEAGTDYFELTDATRNAVNAYVEDHPDATIADVRARFFDPYEAPVPGRALPGRVVEAAGTKTVQLLLTGHYGGYFEPDVHYIPLRRDLSNVPQAVEKLRDDALCTQIVDTAYDVARERLTYGALLDAFHRALVPLL